MNPPRYLFLILVMIVISCAGKPPATQSAAIFDEKADAHRDIAAAVAHAEGSKENIVLIFGANW